VIVRLDHLVLTVADVDATAAFYERTLGMKLVTFEGERVALVFGEQKLNLHQAGAEIEPKAYRPTPGSADLCFVTEASVEMIAAHLGAAQVSVELGPVARTGARGPIWSFYFRDPDGNLVELSTYDTYTDR
jgi:catechol 2,3-dioxygenase-like lactoylglutathione lyase family enzyme